MQNKMKSILIGLSLLLLKYGMIAQSIEFKPIAADTSLRGLDVTSVIQFLTNETVKIPSARLLGHPSSIGKLLQATPQLGFAEGLVLSTGRADQVLGHPLDQIETDFGLTQNEFFREQIDYEHEDAILLELLVEPVFDSLFLDYVFASEDYGRFRCSRAIDRFGVFIYLPTENEWINIATIPDKPDVPVCANTVNRTNGTRPFYSPETCKVLDPDFVANTHLFAGSHRDLSFNGKTIPLTTRGIQLEKGKTYSIRIIIADNPYKSGDSAIFLAGQSFSSTREPAFKVEERQMYLCLGDTLEIGGEQLFEPGLYEIPLYGADDRDSILLQLTIEAIDGVLTKQYESCRGDTIFVLDTFFVENASYWQPITTEQPTCYIEHQFNFTEKPFWVAPTADFIYCEGDTVSLTYGQDFYLHSGPEYFGSTREPIPIPSFGSEEYIDTILVEGFPPEQHLDNLDQVLEICAKLEYLDFSFMSMWIECPNQNRVWLKNIIYDLYEARLGEPIIDYPHWIPGIGYDYCWNSQATETLHLYGRENFLETIPAGEYRPANSLDSLVGCPLNGAWTFVINEFWRRDQGTFFEWNLLFNEIPVGAIANSGWSSTMATLFQNDQQLSAVPAAGNYVLTYFVQEEDGCYSDTTFQLQVLNEPRLIGDSLYCSSPIPIISKPTAYTKTPFSLLPNLPNPFVRQTQLQFELNEPASICFTLLNALGQPVEVIDQEYGIGKHEIDIQIEQKGLYTCVVETPWGLQTQKWIALE